MPGLKAEHWRAYARQKRNAVTRGVIFDLTYDEWLSVWQDSGKLSDRGRGLGKYCMSRVGDAGPYAVGNVFIQLFTDNVEAARKRLKVRHAAQRGVYLTSPGSRNPWLARWGSVRLGMFTTEDEARAVRTAYVAQHGQPPRGLKARAAQEAA